MSQADTNTGEKPIDLQNEQEKSTHAFEGFLAARNADNQPDNATEALQDSDEAEEFENSWLPPGRLATFFFFFFFDNHQLAFTTAGSTHHPAIFLQTTFSRKHATTTTPAQDIASWSAATGTSSTPRAAIWKVGGMRFPSTTTYGTRSRP